MQTILSGGHWPRQLRSRPRLRTAAAVVTMLALAAALVLGITGANTARAQQNSGLQGAVGPIDPAALVPQGQYNIPVMQEGFRVYINTHDETITGAQPVDAVRGFRPAKTGTSYGPWFRQYHCTPQDLPSNAMQDHATFTPAQLQQYHLPSATDLGLSVAEWGSLMRQTRSVACDAHMGYQDGHPMHASSLYSDPQSQRTLNAAAVAAKQEQLPVHPDMPAQALDTCIDFCGDPTAEAKSPGTNCPGTTVFVCMDRHWYISGATAPETAWMGFATDAYACHVASCPLNTTVNSYWSVPTPVPDNQIFEMLYTWVGLGWCPQHSDHLPHIQRGEPGAGWHAVVSR